DGKIVVLTQSAPPLTPGMELLRSCRTPRDALQPLRLTVPDDVVAATQIAKAIDWAGVYLLSDAAGDLVEDLFMVPLSDADECRRVIAMSRTTAFVESAHYANVQRRERVGNL